MADIGDVVRHKGSVWKVSARNRDFGTLTLVDADLKRDEVPSDQDLEVLYSTTGWPFVAIPTKSFKEGRIVLIGHGSRTLHLLLDWVPSDMTRTGGALFLNPALGLKAGDVLVARHEKGTISRITITKAFGSIQDRGKRKKRPWKPRPPSTIYDRLTGHNPFEDDD